MTSYPTNYAERTLRMELERSERRIAELSSELSELERKSARAREERDFLESGIADIQTSLREMP